MTSLSGQPGLLAAALLSLALLSGCSAAAPLSNLTADIPADGVDRLSFDAGDGEAQLKASDDDAIHVHLELRQQTHSLLWLVHWYSVGGSRDLKGAVLQPRHDGHSLALSVVYPDGDHPGDVDEKWIISVPARLAVDADMHAGELAIRQLSGGVHANLEAGELVIEAPRGALSASVTYGRLHVISATSQPGSIGVSSTHGLAVLDWDGRYFGPAEEHGFWGSIHLGGNSVAQHGNGDDDIDLRVQYGEADLRIGAPGDVKTYRDLFLEKSPGDAQR
jgi:outer membrane murein-binding lipoprotein Lpp